MVVVEITPKDDKGVVLHKYYLDGYLKANVDHMIKDVTKRNYDGFTLVVGREGFGKSTITMQLAMYCDPTFNLDRVCFTADQFREAVETAPKYSAIVFDETMGYLSARGAMSEFNRVLIKVMSEMRSKNLFVFLCIPNFFMMDWYVAQHRTTGLLYIRQRGRFGSYDYPTKKKLYRQGKKEHRYCVPPNFYGSFVKYFPLDEEDYEKKKQRAINDFTQEKNKNARRLKERNILIYHIISRKLMEKKELSSILGISTATIGQIVKRISKIQGDEA